MEIRTAQAKRWVIGQSKTGTSCGIVDECALIQRALGDEEVLLLERFGRARKSIGADPLQLIRE